MAEANQSIVAATAPAQSSDRWRFEFETVPMDRCSYKCPSTDLSGPDWGLSASKFGLSKPDTILLRRSSRCKTAALRVRREPASKHNTCELRSVVYSVRLSGVPPGWLAVGARYRRIMRCSRLYIAGLATRDAEDVCRAFAFTSTSTSTVHWARSSNAPASFDSTFPAKHSESR